jgi:hypothetical protein
MAHIVVKVFTFYPANVEGEFGVEYQYIDSVRNGAIQKQAFFEYGATAASINAALIQAAVDDCAAEGITVGPSDEKRLFGGMV